MRCVSQGGWEEKSPSCGIVCPYSPQQLVISDTPISKLDQTTNNWSSSILIVWLTQMRVLCEGIFCLPSCVQVFRSWREAVQKYFHPLHCMFKCSLFPFRKMDFVNKIWWWIYKAILLVPPLFRAIPAKTPYIIDCIKNSTFWNEKKLQQKCCGHGSWTVGNACYCSLASKNICLNRYHKKPFHGRSSLKRHFLGNQRKAVGLLFSEQ